MRPITITIDMDPQKIPALVCSDYSAQADSGSEQLAVAVAKALGIEDYLSRPDRIYELRRWMWENGDSLALPSQAHERVERVMNETAPLEMSAD